MKKHLFMMGAGLFCSLIAYPVIVNVPGDYANIHDAIDNANDGDTVLVAQGTYHENLNLKGKKILLTSQYLWDNDTSFIESTIIDGSQPDHPDTASCILIISGEDSITVVQGFTITGGDGTAWKDEHSSGIYREGGGILVALSSLVIRNNLIIKNNAINRTGLAGASGGGIRCGDGSAKIFNNVIIDNNGRYGGGLVFNWCNAVIRNNVIAFNRGGEDYAGGGVWINGSGIGGAANILENNTIVNNHSVTDGGGVLIYNSNGKAVLKNNIIYGNTGSSAPQISVRGGTIPVTFSDIQGEWNEDGNISDLPEFVDSLLYLKDTSPCIDAGDTDTTCNDPVNPAEQDSALFPAKGSTRNDIGAYGGPGRSTFPAFRFSRISVSRSIVYFGNNNTVGVSVTRKISVANQSTDVRQIDSVLLAGNSSGLIITHSPQVTLQPAQPDSIIVVWTPADDQQFTDTLLIYHNTEDIENPLKVTLTGKATYPDGVGEKKLKNSVYNYPNPFTESTVIRYGNNNRPSSPIIMDISGKEVLRQYNLPDREYIFHRGNLESGMYWYQITGEEIRLTGKMVIL